MFVTFFMFFFFSSRRRHTRSDRDWSSDVCSSDLHGGAVERLVPRVREPVRPALDSPARAVQLEEALHRDARLLGAAGHLDGHAGLPEQPLLAAAQVLAPPQALQVLLVRTG